MTPEQQRMLLRNLMDLMSDGHADIAITACEANAAMLKAEEAAKKGSTGTLYTRTVRHRLEEVWDLLESQEARLGRIRSEIQELRNKFTA